LTTKRIFISADHGLAIVYFLQSDVVPTLLKNGVEVVLLTDDGLVQQIQNRFGQPGLIIEGLRLKEARRYSETMDGTRQYWINFLRRVGASKRINVEAMTSHVKQVEFEAGGKRRLDALHETGCGYAASFEARAAHAGGKPVPLHIQYLCRFI